MIYIERTINIYDNSAEIEEPVVLYKGDRNIEVQFIIKNSPFKYKTGIDLTYGQLVIKRPTTDPIFSDVAKLSSGKVLFVITGEMIDELVELGNYDFQVRLLNADKTSRATLPPVFSGILIKEPVCEEEGANYSLVDSSKVATGETLDLFDEDGNYIKTIWAHGDLITDSKLNKIEAALYEINEYDIDLTGYATESYVDSAIETIELTPGPKGEQGEVGPMGPQGPQGDKGEQGETGPAGADGKDGVDFTYDMFTTEQLEALRGPQGEPGKDGVNGEQGSKGDKGDPGQDGKNFTYDMFTPEQLEALRGPSGKDGIDGATGLQGEKGDKGDKGDTGEQGPKGDTGADGKDFTYDMFTPEQLEALRGPQGEPGPAGQDGKDGEQGIQGERGEKGDKGDKGDPGETPSLEGYATITYVDNMLGDIESLLGGI